MSNQEILERAITKAIEGGWLPYFAAFDNHMNAKTIRFIITEGAQDVRFEVVTKGRIYGVSGYSLDIASIIFNHEFCKALWGELDLHDDEEEANKLGLKYYYNSGNGAEKIWETLLQQMVIAPDPIAYLGEYI